MLSGSLKMFFSLVVFVFCSSFFKTKTSNVDLWEKRGDYRHRHQKQQQQQLIVSWLKRDSQPLVVFPDSGALTVLTLMPHVHLLLLSCVSVAQKTAFNTSHQSATSLSKHKKQSGRRRRRVRRRRTKCTTSFFTSVSLRAKSSCLCIPPPPAGLLG